MTASARFLRPEVLARIVPLGLRASRAVEGAVSGRHVSPYHGVSVEFADYREYTAGDDLKRLDWRVYGRSDRFYIRRYEEESNLRAVLLVDASASMRYGGAPMTKFDYAATLAASLAALLIRQQDAAGLALFDRRHQVWLPPAAAQPQLGRIVDALAAARPDSGTDLGAVLAAAADRLTRRGLVIVISDLLGDLDAFFRALGRLQHQGQEMLVFHVLDREEIELPFDGSVLFRDIEGTEEFHAEPWAFRRDYRRTMHGFLDRVRRECRRRGADHLLLTTDAELGAALSPFLHRRLARGTGKH